MIWIVVLGLALWAWLQQREVSRLGEALRRVTLELSRVAVERAPAADAAPVKIAGPAEATPPVEAVLVEPVEAAPPARVELAAPHPPPAPVAPAPPPPAAPARERPRRSASDWLSENGLAWLGGAALALGGLLLVGYAARRGLFTPPFRIGAAVLLGLAALAAGERLRRRPLTPGAPDRLVAALVTAAGAATLYAAIWAAHGLYHFIPGAAAAAGLAAVSLGLVAVSLLYGEPLGLLAVAAAGAVPLVSGRGEWGAAGLDLYALLVTLTGLALAARRGWSVAGALGLVSAGLWGLARYADHDLAGAALLAAAAPWAAIVTRSWRARTHPQLQPSALASAAAVGACVGGLLIWAEAGWGSPLGAGVLALATLAIASGARLKAILPAFLFASAFGVTAASATTAAGDDAGRIGWLLAPILALIAAGSDGAKRRETGVLPAIAAAGGVALAATLGDGTLAWAVGGWRAAADLLLAAMLAVGAWRLAACSADPARDLALGAFVGGAAELVGLALHAVAPALAAPAAYALLAAALAMLAGRLRWRGLAESSAIAGLAAFAGLLGPAVAGRALTAGGGWAPAAACAGAALGQLGAWALLTRGRGPAGAVEALSTLALLSALLGAFLALQAVGTGAAEGLDAFTRASLRTLLLLAAGLVLAVRGSATRWGAWRARALLTAGALHGAVAEALVLHPWWGIGGRVLGPPLADTALLGLLAPALLLAEAARRLRGRDPAWTPPATAAAFAFLFVWSVTELRRLFHGSVLTPAPVGFAETAFYAADLLGLALLISTLAERWGRAASGPPALAASDLVAGLAAAVALWLLAMTASPWWGPIPGDLRSPGLLALGYALSLAAGVALARSAARAGRMGAASAARAGVAVVGFVALTLAIRFDFHGGAMRAPLAEASLETWTFSAAWALYGAAVLAFGAFRRDAALRWTGLVLLLATTLKVFLFDLARLDGVARAASFLALGAVLLAGALAARRLGAERRATEPAEAPPGAG